MELELPSQKNCLALSHASNLWDGPKVTLCPKELFDKETDIMTTGLKIKDIV